MFTHFSRGICTVWKEKDVFRRWNWDCEIALDAYFNPAILQWRFCGKNSKKQKLIVVNLLLCLFKLKLVLIYYGPIHVNFRCLWRA